MYIYGYIYIPYLEREKKRRATTPEERDKLQLEANELSQPRRDEEETILFYTALGDISTYVCVCVCVCICYVFKYTYIHKKYIHKYICMYVHILFNHR
jgi:hypothetical protein